MRDVGVIDETAEYWDLYDINIPLFRIVYPVGNDI